VTEQSANPTSAPSFDLIDVKQRLKSIFIPPWPFSPPLVAPADIW